MRILFIGDIVGAAGRRMVLERLPCLLEEEHIDFTVANGENVTNGFGISRRHFDELTDCGVDCFTMGNHTWDNKDIFNFIDAEPRLLRPANLPEQLPGRGWRCFDTAAGEIYVVNLLGRVFMNPCDCPFAALDRVLKEIGPGRRVLVDFHAEATSEKMALGWYADGRAGALVGTHTHIQTNDARILPRGLAYITDAGMTGPRDSVLGVEKEIIVQRFLLGYSEHFRTAGGDLQFNGVLVDLDSGGKAREIRSLNVWQPAL